MVVSNYSAGKFDIFVSVLIDIKRLIKDTWASSSAIAISAIVLHQAFSLSSILLVLAIAIGYSYAYALNDYFDQPYDEKNPLKIKLNIFLQNKYNNKFYLVLLMMSLVIMTPIFAIFGTKGWMILGISLIVPIMYSAQPFRFKSRPIFDLVTHSIFVSTYPYVITLYLLGLDPVLLDYVMISLTVTLSMSVQLENQIRDYEFDKEVDKNFTLKFGRTFSVYFMKTLTFLALVIGFTTIFSGIVPPLLLPAMLLLLPFLFHRLIRPIDKPRSEILVKMTVFIILGYCVFLLVYSFL